MRDVREGNGMSKRYEVLLDYLEHDGGTKFYETVRITELVDDKRFGASILLQRWGKIEANTGGGQIKTVNGSINTTDSARTKILKEKMTPRAGKGVYNRAAAPVFGLGRIVPASNLPREVKAEDLYSALNEHYGPASCDIVVKYFDMHEERGAEPADDIVSEGEEHDRGTNWASW
jgi:hypothetical protein